MKDIDLRKLGAKFPSADIEWRIGRGGKTNGRIWAQVLAYITNRAIQSRLDEVCGPENWQNDYKLWRGDSQLCGISIRIDGDWVTKWDGAPDTHVESIKGGLSDSMKRAGVMWKIGRYLYRLPVTYADILQAKQQGAHWDRIKYKEGSQEKEERIWWLPPHLPEWALPDYKPPQPAQESTAGPTNIAGWKMPPEQRASAAMASAEETYKAKDLAKLKGKLVRLDEIVTDFLPKDVESLRAMITSWVAELELSPAETP